MGDGGPLPDELRCNRNDGRDWRCKRRVLEGKKLCEIHYVQGRLRQSKQEVPESLKIKRREDNREAEIKKEVEAEENAGIRVSERIMKRRKRTVDIVENSSDSADKGAGKKTRTELFSLRMKREIEKTMKKGKKKKVMMKSGEVTKRGIQSEDNGKEVTRDLPYGLMAIAPAPAPAPAPTPSPSPEIKAAENEGSSGVKLGVHPSNYIGNRKFRSKNASPPPIVTMKVVPYGGNVAGKAVRKRRCHWCRSSNDDRSLVKCLSCKRQFFCSNCIKERYMDDQEVKSDCPVCRQSCNCKKCCTNRSKDVGYKEIPKDQGKISKFACFHYMIRSLLPVLKKINQEQGILLEMEAQLKGKNLSEVEIGQADFGNEKQCICNNCKCAILDLHRSCPNCSYNLCLKCCLEFSQVTSTGSVEIPVVQKRRLKPCGSMRNLEREAIGRNVQNAGNANLASASLLNSAGFSGSISCPSMDMGGCDTAVLDLRSLLPVNLVKELERAAEEIVSSQDSSESLDHSFNCSLCEAGKDRELLEASRRKFSCDNFLYCPSACDKHDNLLLHFQKHWQKGHPVIMRNMLYGASNLSWDPVHMFCSYLEKGSAKRGNEKEDGRDASCSDSYEVEFGINESFTRSLGEAHTTLQRKTLRLKAKLSSAFSQRLFIDHCVEILFALPLQEYTNPRSGLLNLAAKLPEELLEPNLGPHINIICGTNEEVVRGDLVTNLYYNSHDVINILVHATDAAYTSEQLCKMEKLLRKEAGEMRDAGKNLENGLTLEHSEITEEAGLQDRVLESTHLNSKTNLKNGNVLPVSDIDSDGLMDCYKRSDSHGKSMDQTLHVDHMKSSKRSFSEPCVSAQWDVFRRQDTPKLLEYIRRHASEFNSIYGHQKHAVNPILDGRTFLDGNHKIRLEEEFKIVPWTFNQHVGEAVIIPAGCPYQIRSIKSCTSVAMGFVSPENSPECIKLMEERRVLPEDHMSKQEYLEQVEKMTIHRISEAIKEIRKLTQGGARPSFPC
ncbi:hypothetical protein Ancab_033714 [Ancistrocladus abbreviatus]